MAPDDKTPGTAHPAAPDAQHQNDAAAAELADGAVGGTPVGDSTAETTQAAPEATTPRVLKAGDTFPWEFRVTAALLSEAPQELRIPCVATITAPSRDLVWCDIVPDPDKVAAAALPRLQRVVGFPRHIHVMLADARKAAGLPPS